MSTDPKLVQLSTTGNFRAKVAAVLADLNGGHGWQAHIAQGLRTPAEQHSHVLDGSSHTEHSEHLAHAPDNLSWAADVVDIRYGWSPPGRKYWLQLAASAHAHGLGLGILFGVHGADRLALIHALETQNWDYAGPCGWDPSHLELVQE